MLSTAIIIPDSLDWDRYGQADFLYVSHLR